MTDRRLEDVLAGREDNYILPFYWQHGDHTEKIPEQIERIYRTGCRAVCVEARPHPEFCEAGWWRDMDVIIAECKKRDMRVWILDDKHFPTGYAAGLIEKKYPELQQWMLNEFHVDVMGPMPGASLLVAKSDDPEGSLIDVYAYKRVSPDDQRLDSHPVHLAAGKCSDIISWDIPEGCWRVFFFHKSRQGSKPNYIDLVSKESAAVQIEAVYEPHYERYKEYFGNVIAGFFSDEPCFSNNITGFHLEEKSKYDYLVGQEGLSLPYNERVLARMSEEMGEDALPYLGELWYESDHSHITRLAYMNAVTQLYHENFSRPVGDWCRAHNVEYIGHIIEDMDAHGRLGYGPGHYFRAIEGQDMGGIDIVLHQVMPGFDRYNHTACVFTGSVSPEFFNYVLGKLGASISHQVPHMRGRAMCEIFGAYGWAESATMMKWLIDFLLVRGINHFVPHAFSPQFPDNDCPPHFGAEGHDPQLDGFTALMGYTNKMAHLLNDTVHVASVALLYHAEAEWMSGIDKAMLMRKPAKRLYDAHIDFDIVCGDTLIGDCAIEDGKMKIAKESFGALVVPGARFIPDAFVKRIGELQADGVPVFFVGEVPEGCKGEAVSLEGLVEAVRAAVGSDVEVLGDFPLLRIYHVRREGNDIYMLFNESYFDGVKTTLKVPSQGGYARLRLAEDFAASGSTDDGCIEVDLLPGQSEVIVFGGDAGLPSEELFVNAREVKAHYKLEIASSDDMEKFEPYCECDELFNINAADKLVDFSGKVRYTFELDLTEEEARCGVKLDLGNVGFTAKLWANGQYKGIRIAKPYAFVLDGMKVGKNEIVVEVANTLAQKVKDFFSKFMAIPPAGIMGRVFVAQRQKQR